MPFRNPDPEAAHRRLEPTGAALLPALRSSQSHTQQIFQHRLVAPQGHTPQVQVQVERSVETDVVENKGLQGGAHLQGRDGWTRPRGQRRPRSCPVRPSPDRPGSGRARAQGGWGKSRPCGASNGQGGRSEELWSLAPQPGQEQLSRLDPHVDRAALSPWWVTPTHPRPRSCISLSQKVSGGAGQDPSCPAPRVGGGPRGNHPTSGCNQGQRAAR